MGRTIGVRMAALMACVLAAGFWAQPPQAQAQPQAQGQTQGRAQPPRAQGPQASPVVLEVEGWTRRMGRNGLLFFACGTAACGGSRALLSVRQRPPMPHMTLDGFARNQRESNARVIASGTTDVRFASEGRPEESERRGVRIFSASRDFADDAGETIHIYQGLLVGARMSMSVVSSAATSEQARANFERFVPGVVDLLAPP